MVRSVYSLLKWPYDLLINPTSIVDSAETFQSDSLVGRIRRALTILAFFLVNVLLYTLPLSYGSQKEPSLFVIPPGLEFVFQAVPGNGQELANFTLLLIENSLILIYATLITLVIYHVGVWLTRKSKGWLHSMEIITLTTGIYLALIFNLVIIGANHFGPSGDILMWVQFEFLQEIIRLTGGPFSVSVPEPPNLANMTAAGRAVLTGLIILICYYAYVLYLGAHRVHGLSRIESVFVVSFVAIAPILFVSASVTILYFSDLPPGLFGLEFVEIG